MVMLCAIAEEWHAILDIMGQPTTRCNIRLRRQSTLMIRCRRHNAIDTCCFHIIAHCCVSLVFATHLLWVASILGFAAITILVASTIILMEYEMYTIGIIPEGFITIWLLTRGNGILMSKPEGRVHFFFHIPRVNNHIGMDPEDFIPFITQKLFLQVLKLLGSL